MSWLTINIVAEANLAAKLLSRLNKLSLQGVRNNSYEPSGLLINVEDVKLAISKMNLKTVMFAINVKLAFSPTSLLQTRHSSSNVTLAEKQLRVSAPKRESRIQQKTAPERDFAFHFENARFAFSRRLR